MTKQEWITQYRDRAIRMDAAAFKEVLRFYCKEKNIEYNELQFHKALQLMDLQYMYRWMDVHFGVVLVQDKQKNIIGVF